MLSRITSKAVTAARIVQVLSLRTMGTKVAAKACVKPGATLMVDGSLVRVDKIQHGGKARAGGFVKAKVKKVVGGGTFEKSFDSGEMVELAEIETEKAQYSWEDSDAYVFMDLKTYDELRIPKEDVSSAKFMEEGAEVKVQSYEGKIIGVVLPKIVELKVESIIPAGAKLSSGVVLKVPDFIKAGETIKVSTIDEAYLERA